MPYYQGQPFTIRQSMVRAKKDGYCESEVCGKYYPQNEIIDVIRWGPGPDQYGKMHPVCAELHPMNESRKTWRKGDQKAMIAFNQIHGESSSIEVKFKRDNPRDSRYAFRIMPKRINLKDELVSFLQYISYNGGEAEITVSGKGISQDQAHVLADAYLRLRSKNKVGQGI